MLTARFLVKLLISALVIAGVSELGKRWTALAAIVAALPLTTLLTVIWLYAETGDTGRVADLSVQIFWAILPSFVFLWSLPLLLRAGVRFPLALSGAVLLMLMGYAGYVWALRRVGIEI